jgi:uncharacterized protein (DUF433 family)
MDTGSQTDTEAAGAEPDPLLLQSGFPGILLVQRREGPRAALASSGLEVWEIVAAWKEGGEDWSILVEGYPDLDDDQLRTALAYYRLHPAEIDARLHREAAWTSERVWDSLPFSRPEGRRA